MSTDTHANPNLLDRIRMSRARLDTLHRLESEVARLERAAETASAERDHASLLTLLGALLFDALESGPSRTRSLLGELAPAAFPTATTTPPRERPSADPGPVGEAARPKIDAAMLTQLQERLLANQGGGDESASVTFVPAAPMSKEQQRRLEEIVNALGPIPSNLRGARPARREVERVGDVITRTLADWSALDDPTHREVLALVVARLRAVQLAIDKHLSGAQRSELEETVNPLIRRLTLHSATARPGSTHGLAAKHKPVTGDWANDAARAQKALVARLSATSLTPETPSSPTAPKSTSGAADDAIRRVRGELKSGLEREEFINTLWLLVHEHCLSQRDPRVVGLARAALGTDPDGLLASAGLADLARELQKDDSAHDASGAAATPAWPHRERTKGLRAVIVGGDRRPERETAIQKALGLQSLRWIPTDTGFRHVDALTESLPSGNVDLVIVLQRFVSHSITDRLFALRSEQCRVVLATSYGVRAVQEGIERYLGLRDGAAQETPETP